MKVRTFFIFPALFLFCSLFPAGCASPYEPTGYFASYALMEPGPYFKQEFTESLTDFEKYKKIKLVPVILDYFDKSAEYKLKPGDKEWLMSSLESALKKELSTIYKVVPGDAAPDSQTLIVEPALVYARKSQFIIIPGSAAVEVQIMDALTGKTVAQVAEKRNGPLEFIFKKWAQNLTGFIANQKYLAPPVHG